jgi:hypothetical protein
MNGKAWDYSRWMDVNNTGIIKSSLKIRCFSVMRFGTIMPEKQKLTFIKSPKEFKELMEIKCFQVIFNIILKAG